MEHINRLEEKDLENISGGITVFARENITDAIPVAKYKENQKVKFLNNEGIECIGIIRNVEPNPGEDGAPSYIIMVSEGAEASYGVGRPYRVSELNIRSVVV